VAQQGSSMSLYSGIRRFEFENKFIYYSVAPNDNLQKLFYPVFQNSVSLFYASQIYIAVTRGGNLGHLNFYCHDTQY